MHNVHKCPGTERISSVPACALAGVEKISLIRAVLTFGTILPGVLAAAEPPSLRWLWKQGRNVHDKGERWGALRTLSKSKLSYMHTNQTPAISIVPSFFYNCGRHSRPSLLLTRHTCASFRNDNFYPRNYIVARGSAHQVAVNMC